MPTPTTNPKTTPNATTKKKTKKNRKPKADPLNGTRKPTEAMIDRGRAWIAASMLIGFTPGDTLREDTRTLIERFFGELKLNSAGKWTCSGLSKTSASLAAREYFRGLGEAGIRISDIQIPAKRYGAAPRSVTGLETVHADPKSAPESI